MVFKSNLVPCAITLFDYKDLVEQVERDGIEVVADRLANKTIELENLIDDLGKLAEQYNGLDYLDDWISTCKYDIEMYEYMEDVLEYYNTRILDMSWSDFKLDIVRKG